MCAANQVVKEEQTLRTCATHMFGREWHSNPTVLAQLLTKDRKEIPKNCRHITGAYHISWLPCGSPATVQGHAYSVGSRSACTRLFELPGSFQLSVTTMKYERNCWYSNLSNNPDLILNEWASSLLRSE